MSSHKKAIPYKFIPLWKLFPNMVTIIGICVGFIAIKYAIDGRFIFSTILILVAAFIDGIDGGIARMLKATSKLGAELDSLADFLNFGIAPALIIYTWSLKFLEIKGLGLSIALFYTICCAVRLARFNLSHNLPNKKRKEAQKIFIGIPSTIAGILVLLPLMLTFHIKDLIPIPITPIIVAIYTVMIGILMISSIPTLSAKNINIDKGYTHIILVVTGIIISGIIIKPWITIPLLSIIYLAVIPVYGFIHAKKSE